MIDKLEYKYNFSNLKFFYKFLTFVLLVLVVGFIVLYFNTFKNDSIHKLILILIIFIACVFYFIMINFNSSYKYSYRNFKPEEESVTNIANNLSKTLDNKHRYYKLKSKFYIEKLSDYAEPLFYGELTLQSTDIKYYNPVVYIAPNSTDLVVELRVKSTLDNEVFSEKLYNIYNVNNKYDDNEKNTKNKVLNACLNDCNDDCYGIIFGGADNQSNSCTIVKQESSELTQEMNSNLDNQSFIYYKKNKLGDLVSPDKNYKGNKVNYDKLCVIKNLPISKLITCIVEYDHNNIYITIKYGSKQINKICSLQNNNLYNVNDVTNFKFIPYDGNSSNIKLTNFKKIYPK